MKFKATGQCVVATRIKTQPKNLGGIIVHASTDAGAIKFKVIDLGLGEMRKDGSAVNFTVKIGDTVLVAKKNADIKLTLEGVDYHIINEANILGIVED